MDEARFGLKTWHQRRWCPTKGFRPPWIFEDQYEWLWLLYAAVEPETGESFCLYFLPNLDGDCFGGVFLEEFEKAYPDEEIVLVLDGAPGHRSGQVKLAREDRSVTPAAAQPRAQPARALVRGAKEGALQQGFRECAGDDGSPERGA